MSTGRKKIVVDFSEEKSLGVVPIEYMNQLFDRLMASPRHHIMAQNKGGKVPKQRKKPGGWFRLPPPLSAQAEVAFYLEQQEHFEQYQQSLGDSLLDSISFLPTFSFEQKKRVNNRSSGWNGLFT